MCCGEGWPKCPTAQKGSDDYAKPTKAEKEDELQSVMKGIADAALKYRHVASAGVVQRLADTKALDDLLARYKELRSSE